MPKGANAVAIQEEANVDGNVVEILRPANPGDHIRRKGQDFVDGES